MTLFNAFAAGMCLVSAAYQASAGRYSSSTISALFFVANAVLAIFGT